MNVQVNDRYEHRESKAPVVVIDTFADRAGFGHNSVTYRFICDTFHKFEHCVPLAEFNQWYKPGMGEM